MNLKFKDKTRTAKAARLNLIKMAKISRTGLNERNFRNEWVKRTGMFKIKQTMMKDDSI